MGQVLVLGGNGLIARTAVAARSALLVRIAAAMGAAVVAAVAAHTAAAMPLVGAGAGAGAEVGPKGAGRRRTRSAPDRDPHTAAEKSAGKSSRLETPR